MKSSYAASSMVDAGAMDLNHWLLVLWLFLCLLPLSPLHANTTLEQWRQQATELRWLADNDPARAYHEAQKLRDRLPTEAEPADRVRMLNLLARAELYLAKIEQAAEHARQALEMAEQRNDRVGQVEAQLNISIIEIHRGNISASAEAVADGVKLLDGVDRPDLLAEVMLRLSTSYLRLNLLDDAVTLALQNLEIARQNNNPFALLYAYQALGIVSEKSGRYQAAYDYFQQMYESARKAQSKRWEGQSMIGMAMTVHHLGDSKQAEQLLLKAITLYREVDFPLNLAPALYSYAYLLSEQQRYAEAAVVLEEDIGIYQQYHNRVGLWFTLNAYADNLQKLGRKSKAQEATEQAYRLAQDLDFPIYVSQSAERMAKVVADSGDYQRAYRYIAEATEMAERYASEKAGGRILELTKRYKEESKQREINKLNRQAERHAAELKQQELQQRWLATILLASILLLSASSWFLLKLRRSNRSLTTLNREVQLSQSKLQATVDAIPDLLFVLDREGTYLEFHSPMMSHLLYAPAEQILGNKIVDLLPGDVADICMQAIAEASEQGLSTGRQIKLMLADGNEYWFELSVARKAMMPGEEQQFIGLSRDITERKKMEQELAASEQQFRALVENSPDYVVRYDAQGRRLYINPALQSLMGEPAKNYIGKTLDDWSIENFDPDYHRQLKRVIETGEEGRLTMSVLTGTGQEAYSDIRFVPEFDAEGRVANVLAVGRDITALKQAEQEIEKAYEQIRKLAVKREEELEEERKRIARDMHDELGQYLTSLRLNLSVLRMQPDIDSEARDKKLQLMMALLDETIQVVRKIASQLRPAQLQMGVGAALEWLADDFSDMTGVACELSLDCEESQMSDSLATAIFRVVQESLTNVARYARATRVEISLRGQENGYHVRVRDNGIGFDPNNIKKKSLGLLGMRERVANLGGDIELSSMQGQGTMIAAFFPESSTEAAISEV